MKEIQSENSSDIELVDGEFIVGIKSSKQYTTTNNTALIKKIYEDWLIEEAQSIFKQKVDEYSKKLGVRVKDIAVKLLKIWGSTTKEGTINLNANLVKAPEDIIDYIILHELCHLKIREHSHHYWDYVRRYMPDYQQKIDWLTVNGIILV